MLKVPEEDLITEEKLREILKTHILGKKIYAFRSIGSTNEFAYRLALQGEAEGALIIAEEQTKGRGRMGRRWESPLGKGLWFSLILRPPILAEKAALYLFMTGVSIADAIKSQLQINPEVKWPNDLLIRGRKVCGILSEVEFMKEMVNFIILGIGINVNQLPSDFHAEFRDRATSLMIESKRPVDRLLLFKETMAMLEKNYLLTQQQGFEEIIQRWKGRCSQWGKPVTLVQGEHLVEGIFEDLAEDGGLLLRGESGVLVKILAGDYLTK